MLLRHGVHRRTCNLVRRRRSGVRLHQRHDGQHRQRQGRAMTSSSVLKLRSRYSSSATSARPKASAGDHAHQVVARPIRAERPFRQPRRVEQLELLADLAALEVGGDLRSSFLPSRLV